MTGVAWRDLTVAVGSTPHHARKRALVPPSIRARLAARRLNALSVDVFVDCEAWTGTRREFGRRKRWTAHRTTRQNSMLRRRGIEIGTDVATRGPWERTGPIEQIVVWIDDGRQRPTYLPVIPVGLAGETHLYVIAVHAVRHKLDPDGNARARRLVDQAARRLEHSSGLPVLIGGDFNRGRGKVRTLGRVLASDGGVIHLLKCRGETRIRVRRSRVVRARWLGRVSDHPLLVAHLRVAVPTRRKP